jgi:hypothetical protein
MFQFYFGFVIQLSINDHSKQTNIVLQRLLQIQCHLRPMIIVTLQTRNIHVHLDCHQCIQLHVVMLFSRAILSSDWIIVMNITVILLTWRYAIDLSITTIILAQRKIQFLSLIYSVCYWSWSISFCYEQEWSLWLISRLHNVKWAILQLYSWR